MLTAEPVTKLNWRHHPNIENVRSVVAEVDAAMAAGKLVGRVRECEFEKRTLRVDDRGVVRFYQWDAGGEDSADLVDYYYDPSGRLRFLHAKGGAVPNAARETRLWFDESGRRLWRLHTFHGEGMDFDPEEYPEFIVRDPRKHYAGKPIHYQGPDACTEGPLKDTPRVPPNAGSPESD